MKMDIHEEAKRNGVKMWRIARVLGYSIPHFSRLGRKGFTDAQKKILLDIINSLRFISEGEEVTNIELRQKFSGKSCNTPKPVARFVKNLFDIENSININPQKDGTIFISSDNELFNQLVQDWNKLKTAFAEDLINEEIYLIWKEKILKEAGEIDFGKQEK